MVQLARTTLRNLGLMAVAQRAWCEVVSRARGIELRYARDFVQIRRGGDAIRVGRGAHEVYVYDMIVFFDYYFAAVVPVSEADLRIVDYSKPKVHELRQSHVSFEFPALPESDESTEMYLKALRLTPGEIVLDLGAYAGGSSYFFAQAVGAEGRVLAFEPDLTSLEFLRRNVARHALTNVDVFDLGVWKENTTLAFQAEGSMGSSISSILKRDSNVRHVRVVTLEKAAALAGGRAISAIKMDIEGAEVDVLESAREFLRRSRPRLVIEPHKVNGTMTTAEVMRILAEIGYNVEVLSQGSQEWPLIAASPADGSGG